MCAHAETYCAQVVRNLCTIHLLKVRLQQCERTSSNADSIFKAAAHMEMASV